MPVSSLNTLIDTALAGWTEEQWCQHSIAMIQWDDAVDFLDNSDDALDPRAKQWCAVGRLCRAAGISNVRDTNPGDLMWQLVEHHPNLDISEFNDTHTFAQTREMLLSLKEPT